MNRILSYLRSDIYLLLVLFVGSALLCACTKEEVDPYANRIYKPTVLEVNKAYTEDITTSSSDTVVVFLQGGPEPTLRKEAYETYFDGLSKFSPGSLNIVNLHQANTVNATIWQEGRAFTYGDAAHENKQSIKMIENTIKKLSAEGKKIFLMGHSFGGYLLLKFLAEGDAQVISQVEKIVVMGARVELEEALVQMIRAGNACGYDEDNNPLVCSEKEMEAEKDFFIRQKLGVNVIEPRYTQLLWSIDLSNVIFVYGNQDDQGILTSSEINFLSAKRATLLLWPDEGHSTFLEKEDLIKTILDAVRAKQ